MAKWIAIVDNWLIMTVTTFFAAAGLLTIRGLVKGYSGRPWQQAVLSLAVGGLGLWLCAHCLSNTGSNFWIRLIVIAVIAALLWFQPQPWFVLDDSAVVRGGSFQHEFMLQRLEQVGRFLFFVIPFLGLGVLRSKIRRPQAVASQTGSEHTVSLRILVLIVLGAGLLSRLLGMSDKALSNQLMLFLTAGALIIFELARRAAAGDRGVVPALAAIAFGLPIVSFWQF
jgi:hypothetical protein